MDMVSEKKRAILQEVATSIEKYPVIGIVNMHNLPARQLFQIKQQLKGKAVIRMVKKRVIKLALQQSKKTGIKHLTEKIQDQPALLFTDANPFELAHTISKSVSKAMAKAGDIAPDDIIVPAGPTNLPPGPAIGELQKIKIPAGVEGDKIVVKKDTRVARQGEEISSDVADAIAKLGIEPMEISLNLLAVWDSGIVFDKDILFIPAEHYICQIKSAYSNAFNIALNIDYLTAETLPPLLSKAHQQAVSLAMEAEILTSETVGNLLAKAHGQAARVQGMINEEVAEKPSEEGAEKVEAGKEVKAPAPEEGEKEEAAPAGEVTTLGEEKKGVKEPAAEETKEEGEPVTEHPAKEKKGGGSEEQEKGAEGDKSEGNKKEGEPE